ncbi:MAG TPA: stage II sporulation protein M [Steroidobacteraceae bacterium]
MTPLQFEQRYQAEWDELQSLLARLHKPPPWWNKAPEHPLDGERVATLYRRACEHLALARARSYPAYLTERLEQLTADAHQLIYQQVELGLSRLKRIIASDFPRSVRAHAAYVWIALAVFATPTLVLGCLIYFHPDLILTVVRGDEVADYERMYSSAAESIGRTRDAGGDWTMFGFYIRNNITIAFQCFAAGLFAGLGSLFYLAWNGAFSGAVGGYLTARGLGSTFYSFIVTHSAFELTAIVLAGAAGLRLGHSLLMPGRRTRGQALVVATKESAAIIYGVFVFLVVAAAIEGFWSSATWIPPGMKYGVAALCWTGVISYLTLQGRSAR